MPFTKTAELIVLKVYSEVPKSFNSCFKVYNLLCHSCVLLNSTNFAVENVQVVIATPALVDLILVFYVNYYRWRRVVFQLELIPGLQKIRKTTLPSTQDAHKLLKFTFLENAVDFSDSFAAARLFLMFNIKVGVKEDLSCDRL